MNLQTAIETFSKEAGRKLSDLVDSSMYAYITSQMNHLREIGQDPKDWELVITQSTDVSLDESAKVLYAAKIQKIK